VNVNLAIDRHFRGTRAARTRVPRKNRRPAAARYTGGMLRTAGGSCSIAVVLLVASACGSSGAEPATPTATVDLPPPTAHAGASSALPPPRDQLDAGREEEEPRAGDLDVRVQHDGGAIHITATSGDGGVAFSFSGSVTLSADGGRLQIMSDGGALRLRHRFRVGVDGGSP
jgi:hypothetical protein